ncbi:hypothetical protein RQM59_07395 [Flavobacteriaceae bacterium S356]|uniref:Plasmid pRiA4b Orf3-like domain-containing protein n=1 Tax=Asprobacillus argus TaxID=3076534 RepID=A0ABU3LFZ4_9FLAO|nr:hypothetical protein [Flavobacteriaceae bacterium S356]
MYKIRIILDTQEDVIRTILVKDRITLEELHFSIAKSFGFDATEMASFYLTDDEWNQGEEIPLFNMSDDPVSLAMNTCILNEALPNIADKLIYVYDFLKMWAFYVEVVEISSETSAELPKTILTVGSIPDEAPEKEFVAEDLGDDPNEDFNDGFESLDDFDFDNY